ncbi:AIPR family protein [Sporosarcina koreensis]|uniref:AIPR family protein n=1 Tax=Sporosarcina koreensis TaxID=334735 RepID=UPI00075237ED|nr:AIPR family protein [Sporosarcina koreensis]
MATLNDYKIVRDNSKKLIKLLLKERLDELNLDDINTARYGFYHLIMENVLGFQADLENNDFEIIEGKLTQIIDVNYLNKIRDLNFQQMDDYGIDIVNISELSSSEVDINLFNFKYRGNFSDGHIGDRDINRSIKFLEILFADDNNLDESVNTYTHKILNILKTYTNSESKYICNITLYMVSNENNGIHENSLHYIESLKKLYNVHIKSITLDEIMGFYDYRNQNKRAGFIIPQEDLISFNLDAQTTSLSLIVKLPINELIRITCDNSDFPNEKNPLFEKWKNTHKLKMDQSLLYDNVRGFLGKTPYNKKIIDTLKESPDNFFLFNNGVTMIAETIESVRQVNKFDVSLSNFQIVNGGQTVSSIFTFINSIELDNKSDEEINSILTPIFTSFVLLRLYKVPTNSDLKNLIAEYTNSQNSISDMNLKSISKIQIQIEQHLKQHNIIYARKAGDIGNEIENPELRIDMAELAQIIYASKGNPEKVSSQKKKLFNEFYSDIFPDDLNLDTVLELIKSTERIKMDYKSSNYSVSDQKAFYILHMVKNHNLEILHSIDILEYALRTFRSSTALSNTRKLIQIKFKNHLEDILQNNY